MQALLKFAAIAAVVVSTASDAQAITIRGSSIYTKVNGPLWAQAEANAIQLGGHLVAIGSAEENSFLFSAFNLSGDWDNPSYQPLWAGLSDAAQEGSFVWSNGEPLTYTNWAPSLPQYNQGCASPDGGTPCQPTDEDYLHLGRFPGGYWNDAADSISRTTQGIAEIPFQSFNNNAYVRVQGATLNDAIANALVLGGTIVTNPEVLESAYLAGAFAGEPVDRIARIPLSSQVPGPFPIFGAAAAFTYSRKLKTRIKSAKSATRTSH